MLITRRQQRSSANPTTIRQLARRIAVGLVAVLAAAVAPAAELITLEDECRGRQLLISGPIEAGDFERVSRHLGLFAVGGDLPAVQDPETLWTVKLDSPGGDAAEAMRIGRLLRRALVTTEASYRYARRDDGVWDFQRNADTICLSGEGRLAGCFEDVVKAQCAGACLLVWLAGADRFAHEGELGLHGLAAEDRVAQQDYLEEMDVPATWIARLSDGGVATTWLSWPERKALSGRAGALTRLLASCPVPLSPDEAFESVTAASAQLRERLMDRAEAHRRCRLDQVAEARAPVLDALLRPTLPAPGL
ncbi:MAG: hypothetical protein ACNA7W_04385 [Pseudomonadales bacterium]